MGFYVFTAVNFAVHQADGLFAIAEEYYSKLCQKELINKTILHFLQSAPECIHGSSKGDGFAWSAVGNYVHLEEFIDELKPFFVELYNNRVIGCWSAVLFIESDEHSSDTRLARLHLSKNAHARRRDPIVRDISTDLEVEYHSLGLSIFCELFEN